MHFFGIAGIIVESIYKEMRRSIMEETTKREWKLTPGRPSDLAGRLPKEIRVYDMLDRLGVGYEYVDHPAAMTMEDCLAVDQILDAVICKNLFLCNQQKTRFYLLMMPGDKKFRTKDLSKQIGSSRLSFAPEEFMEKYLDKKDTFAAAVNDTDYWLGIIEAKG